MGMGEDETSFGGRNSSHADFPYPYAREAHKFIGYLSWVGRDFYHRLQDMERVRREHPDITESPAWPFMLEEYTRLGDFMTTSTAQRNSLRLLDRNASLSRDLSDLRSRHSICVERPEYDRVLTENERFSAEKERLAKKNKQVLLQRIQDAEEIAKIKGNLAAQWSERETQIRQEADLHRQRAEEELERRWRLQSEDPMRKAAEDVETRWRLQSEEAARKAAEDVETRWRAESQALTRRVDELNLILEEERRASRTSLDSSPRDSS